MKYMRPGAIWAVYEALKKNLQERQNMILKSANEVRNMQYRVDWAKMCMKNENLGVIANEVKQSH